jgi:REP element-mobilizing transposase RayT
VYGPPNQPVIVFLTVCTVDRRRWLACDEVHDALISVWSEAGAWLVGRYALMPDHIHLFAAPGELEIEFDNWVRYWKAQFTRFHATAQQRWQTDHWDSRLRSSDSSDAKWEYVRNNPVRHGLVKEAADWPYQGELNVLPWVG